MPSWHTSHCYLLSGLTPNFYRIKINLSSFESLNLHLRAIVSHSFKAYNPLAIINIFSKL